MSALKIVSAGKSDIGRRKANEDSYLIMTSEQLGGVLDTVLIVADGMGGRASGATASSTAVNSVRDTLTAELRRANSDISSVLDRSLTSASNAVHQLASTKPELQGMGTTCVVLGIDGNRAFFSHLGDSRAYLLRDGNLTRLTEDHSLVAEKVKDGTLTEEQARTSRFRNVITRAAGLEPDTRPDNGSMEIRSGDVFLVCTDGLSVPVADPEIADILCTSATPDEACKRLVSAALRNGGSDNITVTVTVCGEAKRSKPAKTSHPELKKKSGWLMPAVLFFLIGVGLGVYPVHNAVWPQVAKFLSVPARQQSKPQVVETGAVDVYMDPEPLISHVPLQGRFLAVDGKSRIYLADKLGRIFRVDASGGVDSKYPARETFRPFVAPRSPGLATDSDGNLYISDPAGKRIQKFSVVGKFLQMIGEGKLTGPEALAVDRKGDIFVIDTGRLKVIRKKGTGDQ